MNQNKLNGLLAEIDFRNHVTGLGFGQKVSIGGWIVRNVGPSIFGHETMVLFPEIIQPGDPYPASRNLPDPAHGLHTICSTFHQLGIQSYYCAATINRQDDASSIIWHFVQLGLPVQQQWIQFPFVLSGYSTRGRRYNFLRYNTDVSDIPTVSIPEEFSKENLRVAFQNQHLSEISDVDGILWGQQHTYPIEIKEKTAGTDKQLGDYFGLDAGPFVKLAFYAAKGGNLHSIFVVREIDDTQRRNLVNWWYITFSTLAQFASWKPIGGGVNMLGGGSTVIRIPKSEFSILDRRALNQL